MTRPPFSPAPRTATARRLSNLWMPLRGALLAALIALLAAGQLAAAQAAPASFTRILPETTLLAIYAQPGGGSAQVFEELAAELDLDAARETLRKLGVVLGSAADDAFDLGLDLSEPDGYDEMIAELTATCPALGAALEGVDPDELSGRVALGVSMSAYSPLPAVMAILRTDDPELGNAVFDAITGCYDSGVALSEGDVPFYVLGDGSDFPVVVAQLDDTLLLASDPEALRGMVRRAGGANEPSLAGTRIGGLARGLTGRGVAFTLNLAAVADLLANFAPMLGSEPEQLQLIERVLNTLRVVNGVAASAAFDDAGLVIDTVVAVDREVAEAAGERELLDLLSCSGCTPAAPSLIPAGAASLSRSSYSVEALVAWLDSWLADIEALMGDELPPELSGGRLDVAGLAEYLLGVGPEGLGLGWLGSTSHVAQLGVYDTDLASWIQGPGLISVTPVSSERSARGAMQQWREAMQDPNSPLGALVDGSGPGDDVLAGMTLDRMLSFRTATYRGVTYERLRSPFAGDYAVAVVGGHIVFAQPARAIEAVIDVHLGAPSVLDDPVLGGLVASQPEAPAGYQLIDLPRYLDGVAAITDLAANPLASTAYLAVQVAASEAMLAEDEADGEATLALEDVPTFDELISLADLATEALRLLADRSGIAIGSSEIIDGAHWSTLRVPLR